MSLHSTTWSPTRRYSAVAVFSQDLERVVLIHKLRPAWQAGKANFPGGKVDRGDWKPSCWNEKQDRPKLYVEDDERIAAHRRCAARELQEETGLVVDASSLTLFCTLRFRSHEGDDAECQFFCCRGDVEAARTIEQERVFIDASDPDAAELLAIRNGAWSYDELIAWARKMDDDMVALEASSTLPKQSDHDAINALCVEIIEEELQRRSCMAS